MMMNKNLCRAKLLGTKTWVYGAPMIKITIDFVISMLCLLVGIFLISAGIENEVGGILVGFSMRSPLLWRSGQ